MEALSLTELDFTAARKHAHEASRCAITARTTGATAVHHAILCGIELIRLRVEYGPTQGLRRDIPTSPHRAEKLNWPDLVQQHVGISDETARRWMAAARTSLEKIGSGASEFLALPEKSGDRGAIEERLREHVADKSLTELGRMAADAPAPKKPIDQDEADAKLGMPEIPRSRYSATFHDLDVDWERAKTATKRKFLWYHINEVMRLLGRIERLQSVSLVPGKIPKSIRRPYPVPPTKPKPKPRPAKKGQKKS